MAATAPLSGEEEALSATPPDDLKTDPALPPTALSEADIAAERRWTLPKILLWAAIALLLTKKAGAR